MEFKPHIKTGRDSKNQSQKYIHFSEHYFKIEFYWIHIDIVYFQNSNLYMLLALKCQIP